MENQRICDSCGAPLPDDEEGVGGCPACVLAVVASLPPSGQIGGEKEEDSGDGADTEIPIDIGELPKVLGPYRLGRQLGEGGFGIVYAAEQRGEIRRSVAIKIIKAGLESAEIITRFEAERQALALMEHQNIARVLDAGRTPNGRPYFVMELVKGKRLTEYCQELRPSLEELLRLFVRICAAVAHAHQRGIIHRDIKPSNILIEGEGAKAVPKIIDFGIAKATSALLTEDTLLTRSGQLLGTIEYMSPEQSLSGGFDVDVRSDVYSIGAVLYELLCGEPLVKRPEDGALRLDQLVDTIRNHKVARPSTVGGEWKYLAKGTQLARARDLDWIVLKALDKERSRRYSGTDEFAQDLEAFLAGRPVRARAPSIRYRTGKFLKRNRKAVAAIAAGVVLLAGALTAVGLERRAERTRILAGRFLVAPPAEARALLPEVRRGAGRMTGAFEGGDNGRAALGLALAGRRPWAEVIREGWSAADYAEMDLLLVAAPVAASAALEDEAWKVLQEPVGLRDPRRLGAALTAARADPDDARWAEQLGKLADWLVLQALDGGGWAPGFRPLAAALAPELIERLMRAEPAQLRNVGRVLREVEPAAAALLLRALPGREDIADEEQAARAARLAVALILMGEQDAVWPKLVQPAQMHNPRLHMHTVHSLAAADVSPARLMGWAEDASLHPTLRSGMLRALGDFTEQGLDEGARGSLQARLETLAGDDRAAVHAAALHLVAKWFGSEAAAQLLRRFADEQRRRGDGEWSVGDAGHAMAHFPADLKFDASPAVGEGRIPHAFALGMQPVTRGQFQRSMRAMDLIENPQVKPLPQIAPSVHCPMVYLTAQAAMEYCNWVSQSNGIAPEQWCYVAGPDGLAPAQDFLQREGFRLPTEREWEFGCRAWSSAARPWGDDAEIGGRHYFYRMRRVGWTVEDVFFRAPSGLGLFGSLGNVEQPCTTRNGDFILRGASLFVSPALAHFASRREMPTRDTWLISQSLGFRLARTLTPAVD